MELYVLRHGIAADVGHMGAKTDLERPLTSEGRERTQQASTGLAHLGVHLDQIISSPLVRTRQTAEIVSQTLDVSMTLAHALAPGCMFSDLQVLLRPYVHLQAVMIVGHEPDCSSLVSTLIGGGRLEFKKMALARVDLLRLEAGAGTLVWMLQPSILRVLGTNK